MSKTLKTAALVTAFAAGAGVSQLVATKSLPNKHTLKLINAKLVREDLPDGGVQWNGRACGYDQVDGGTVAEPCWLVKVPGSTFSSTAASILDQTK